MKAIEKWLWHSVSDKLNLRGGLFCQLDVGDEKKVVVLSALGVPIEPFNGTDNGALADAIREARSVNKPHEHSIKKWALSNILPRHGISGGCCPLILFAETLYEDIPFCFIGIPKDNQRNQEAVSSAKGALLVFGDYFYPKIQAAQTKNRLQVVELYTKEVGHDLANATQALLAKLRAISDIELSPDAMKRKASECIGEVQQVYGIADGLGVAIEQEYVTRSSLRFGIVEIIQEAINHLSQEAEEHKIKLNLEFKKEGHVRGDKAALRLAIQQLLGNSIKYSHPDRTVFVRVQHEEDQIVLFVTNEGIGLPKGGEASKIYDFGYRSKLAKDRHVNGSGIGLYTCRKIAIAHGGRLWHEETFGQTTFCLALPPAQSVGKRRARN